MGPGMPLEGDRYARTIAISQEAFIDSTIARFNLLDATTVTTLLAPGSHLSVADCATSQDEIEEMATRPYREFVRIACPRDSPGYHIRHRFARPLRT